MRTALEIERELNEFCPELHPRVNYGPEGLQVRCNWGLQYPIDNSPLCVELAKDKFIEYLYQHLGELTVLLHKLKTKLQQ